MEKNRVLLALLITSDLYERVTPIVEYYKNQHKEVEIILYDIYNNRFSLDHIIERLESINCKVVVVDKFLLLIRHLNNSKADEHVFLIKHSQKHSSSLLFFLIYLVTTARNKFFAISNILLIRSFYIKERRNLFFIKSVLIAIKSSLLYYLVTIISYVCYILIFAPIIFLFRRRGSSSRNPKKILFIRTDHIGDMICSLPSLKALRDRYPQAHITVLGASWGSQPLKANPELYDELIICNTPWLNRQTKFKWNPKDIYRFLQVVVRIRKLKFDITLQPRGEEMDVFLAILTNSSVIVSSINYKRPISRVLKKYIQKPVNLNPYITYHISEWPRLILEKINVQVRESDIRDCYNNNNILIDLKRMKDEWTEKGFRTCSIIIGAGNYVREWPSKKFSELIERLFQANIISIIIGSKAELNKRDEILAQVNVSVIDMVAKTNFDNISFLLQQSDFVITLDTSIMHLSSLFDKKIVAMFSSGNLDLAKPIFNKDVTILKNELGCSGCGDSCFLSRPRCIESISVDNVLNAL